MIALIQRVGRAQVEVAGESLARIGRGLLVFIAVERDDSKADADRMLERVLNYRVFADHDGKMNLSVQDIDGGLLLVPQFTLAADTRTGSRPSFTPAASANTGKTLFDYFADQAFRRYHEVACGQFGADMQVSLVNDGPVTFWLQTRSAEMQCGE